MNTTFNTTSNSAARAAAKAAQGIYNRMKMETLGQIGEMLSQNPELELTADQLSAMTGLSVQEIAQNLPNNTRFCRYRRQATTRTRIVHRRFIELDENGKPIVGGRVLEISREQTVYTSFKNR